MACDRAQVETQFENFSRHIRLAIEHGLQLVKLLLMSWFESDAQLSTSTALNVSTGEPLMTVQEAADYLNVHKRTLQGWIESGKIEPRYAEGEPRFKRCELDEWTKKKPHRNK